MQRVFLVLTYSLFFMFFLSLTTYAFTGIPLMNITSIDSDNITISTGKYKANFSLDKAIIWALSSNASDYEDKFVGCTNNSGTEIGGFLVPYLGADWMLSYCLEDASGNLLSLEESHSNNNCVEINRTTNWLAYNCSYYASGGTLMYETILEFFPDHIDHRATYAHSSIGANRPTFFWSLPADDFCNLQDPDNTIKYNSSDGNTRMFDPAGYGDDKLNIQGPYVAGNNCVLANEWHTRYCYCSASSNGYVTGKRYSVRFYEGVASNNNADFVDRRFDYFDTGIPTGTETFDREKNALYSVLRSNGTDWEVYHADNEYVHFDTFILQKQLTESNIFDMKVGSIRVEIFPTSSKFGYLYRNHTGGVYDMNKSYYSIYNDTHFVYTMFQPQAHQRLTQINTTIWDIWFDQNWSARFVINISNPYPFGDYPLNKQISVTNDINVNRVDEVVSLNFSALKNNLTNCENQLIILSNGSGNLTEINSQIDTEGENSTHHWCMIYFLANVSNTSTSNSYWGYYGNLSKSAPSYTSELNCNNDSGYIYFNNTWMNMQYDQTGTTKTDQNSMIYIDQREDGGSGNILDSTEWGDINTIQDVTNSWWMQTESDSPIIWQEDGVIMCRVFLNYPALGNLTMEMYSGNYFHSKHESIFNVTDIDRAFHDPSSSTWDTTTQRIDYDQGVGGGELFQYVIRSPNSTSNFSHTQAGSPLTDSIDTGTGNITELHQYYSSFNDTTNRSNFYKRIDFPLSSLVGEEEETPEYYLPVSGDNVEIYYNLSDEYCTGFAFVYGATKVYYLVDNAMNILDYYGDIYTGTGTDCVLRFNASHLYVPTTFYLYVNNSTAITNRTSFSYSEYENPETATFNATDGGYEWLINKTFLYDISENVTEITSKPYDLWMIPKCNGTYFWSNCTDNETILSALVNAYVDTFNYTLNFDTDKYISSFIEEVPINRTYYIYFSRQGYEPINTSTYTITINPSCGFYADAFGQITCSISGLEGMYELTSEPFSRIILGTGMTVFIVMIFLFLGGIYA